MKVLLLQSPDDPGSIGNVKNLPPLALGIIVSYLRKNNFNVKAYDLNENIYKNYSKTPKEKWLELYNKEFFMNCLNDPGQIGKISDLYRHILEGINFEEYDFVGISTGTFGSFFEIHSSFLLGKLIQTKYNKPVVFGGLSINFFFISNLLVELLGIVLKNFKYIINGPGETSLVRLLQSYENGSIDTVYTTLSGAVYISEGEIIANELDKSTFTCPDYSDFNLDFYKTYFAGTDEETNVKQVYKLSFPFNVEISNFVKANMPASNHSENVLPYFFNQYCPFNCAFCAQSGNKFKPHTKSVKEIVEDLSFLQKQYNTKYFYFLNNTINFTPTFVRDFCTMIIDNGLKIYWSDCARADGMTKDLLALMYKAGCRKLVFGFETGSEKILKYINKRLDKKKVSEALQWCSEIGIYGELEIIVGLPYEYNEDFEATYSFLETHKRYINTVHLNKYFVIFNSLIGKYPEKYGIELIQGENYESMLAWYKQLSIKNFQAEIEDLGRNQFHVMKFNEINGRRAEVIEKETHMKFLRTLALVYELPGFAEKDQFKTSVIQMVNI